VTTKKAQRAAEIEANKLAAFETKVRRLTGQLVSQRLAQSTVQAAYATGISADAYATEIASREPVGRVIHPLKADAVKAAGERAAKIIERVRSELEAGGWDINAVAPYPKSYSDAQARARASLFHTLSTEDRDASRAFFDAMPDDLEERRAYVKTKKAIVTMYQPGVDRFIAQAEDMAASEYDAFICKLVAKVGDCDSAELEGSHVWGHSILTVRKGDVVERWKTQQIINYSSLGNAYPQWPTRLVK
jgi:hypothetical protein